MATWPERILMNTKIIPQKGRKIITVKQQLMDAIKKSGHTAKTIAPLIGLTGATFSLRKKWICFMGVG